ncbi:hypothetical protein Rhopal_000095-T1 [Rhodotorula paludigena]|uniref:Uncharacterized protein n=1 Tax=Rhodotorula paludigena TaxID=86838 RepID=A0AAV5GBS4_9BASI|nr:hypothetical protein Rhopal_000095-T1 [Rhodotorula paludigena]
MTVPLAARSTLRLVLLILPCLAPLLPYLLAAISLYLGLAWARFQVASLLPNLPALLQGPLSHFSDLSLPLPRLPSDLSLASLSALPCRNFGILCRDAHSPGSLELLSASAARTAATRATHALDIFDHLVSLGSGDHAGHSLEPVAIWELATAVRYTSSLDDREFLSQQLSSLGDQSRDVKDHVISLNAQGLNAFNWVV